MPVRLLGTHVRRCSNAVAHARKAIHSIGLGLPQGRARAKLELKTRVEAALGLFKDLPAGHTRPHS